MKYFLVITIVLLIATVIHLFVMNRKYELVRNELVVTHKQYEVKERNAFVHEIDRMHEIALNGTLLCDDFVVLDESENRVLFKELLDGKYKLVLRYSELNCNTCIDAQVNNMQCFVDSTKCDNAFLLVTCYNRNYLRQFKKINRIKLPIYTIIDSLESYLPDIDVPYFFVIDEKSYRVNSAFIPQKEFPQITEDYFSKFSMKYLK